ncbi:carbamoyl-phosphate synthase large subunit [Bacillus cereus]|uniref:carbamoyl-phosphate synthase large subunit n=1 Tax=Bacillus cereus TaxID=1396 RepID=UPI003D653B6E|nr:carbamoyl-phosphate synthase large subunit [Bacillus cereus]
MADGRVEIDARINNNNVRRDVQNINRELNRIGGGMNRTARDMRNTVGREMQGMVGDSEYYARQYRRAYGDEIGGLMGEMGSSFRHMSQEAQNMMFEMQQGFHAQKMAMLPFMEDQIRATHGFYKMAQGSKDFQGTNQEFINQANEIGRAMKASQDAQINANRLAMMGMLETIGAMNAMSSLASKTTKNLDQMKNPLYNTARPALALVDNLDRVARSGSAAQIALELHGPQASMKTLTDEAMRLNSVMMGMPILALGVGMSMLFMYGALHKANMEMEPKYAEAFTNMMEKLTKALEPMRQAFTAVMVPIYNFIAKMAELTIAFNEAHPVMARFIQGTIMLVPALMALMLPLALGVGYFRGLRAILFALRPLIMPVATAFATLSTPVWIVAAAITGATVAFTHFYKTNEKFKGFVDGTIKSIKDFGSALVKNTSELIQSAYKSDMVQNSIKALQTGFATAGKKSLEFGSNMASLGKYLYYTALDGDYLNDWITHLPEGFQDTALRLGESVAMIREKLISSMGVIRQFGETVASLGKYLFWTAVDGDYLNDWITHLPESFQATAQRIGESIATMRERIVSSFADIRAFGENIMSLGKFLFWAAVDGDRFNDWLSHLPAGMRGVALIWADSLISMRESMVGMFPTISAFGQNFMNLGRYLFEVVATGNIMNGWLTSMGGGFQNLAIILGTAIEQIKMSISSFVEAIRLALGGDTSQLGQIFMTIMPTLIGMLLGGLPALLITASHFLPTIVNGINSMLPLLTSTITNIITGIVTVITTYLPQFLEQGIKILTVLIEGILQVLPVVVTTLVEVGTTLINTLVNTIGTLLPVILDAGIKILMAVIEGIVQNLPKIIDAALKVVDSLINTIVKLLPQIIDAGIKILMALIDGIIKILPNLIETAVMLITKICDMLIQNLPKLIDAGIKILLALIDGIIKMLPSLIDAAIKLIVKLVEALIENLPKLIDAGMKILIALIDGIIKILPKLIETGLKLIVEIAKAIIQNLPKILEAGGKILLELIKGIVSLVGELGSTIKDKVIGSMTKKLDDAKKTFFNAGKGLMDQMKKGIENMKDKVLDTMSNIAGKVRDFLPFSPAKTGPLSDLDHLDFGGPISDSIKIAFPKVQGLMNDLLDLPPIVSNVKTNRTVESSGNTQRDTNNTGNSNGSSPTYIVLDKKVVGEALAEPVESTNNRRKQRLAQFKPTVTPSF